MRPPIDLSYAGTRNRTQASGSYPMQSETVTYCARMTTPPSSAFQQLVNVFIYRLKAAGAWSNLVALYLHAAETQQAGLLCMNDAAFDATLTGTPTFTANKGFSGLNASGVNVNWPVTTTAMASDNAGMLIAGRYETTGTANADMVHNSGGISNGAVGTARRLTSGPQGPSFTQPNVSNVGGTSDSPGAQFPFLLGYRNGTAFSAVGAIPQTKSLSAARAAGLQTYGSTDNPTRRLCAYGIFLAGMTDAQGQELFRAMNQLLIDLGAYD